MSAPGQGAAHGAAPRQPEGDRRSPLGPGATRRRVTSRANPLVRDACELLKPAGRRALGAFLAEGIKLIGDALEAGARPTRVFLAPEVVERRPGGRDLLRRLESADIVETTPDVLAWLADTETSQGIVAVYPLPEPRVGPDPGHLLLVLDGVQDPGNVGTLLRSAVACGLVSGVVVRGGADPFGPKAVRAAAGALFHLTIAQPGDAELAETLSGRRIWLAEAAGEGNYDEVDWREPSALIVGSEARGASAELRTLADGRVQIPLRGGVESLNAGVAGSIILFEAARQVALKAE